MLRCRVFLRAYVWQLFGLRQVRHSRSRNLANSQWQYRAYQWLPPTFKFSRSALLWALHGEHYRIGLYLKVFVWCCLGTSVGLYFFSPDLIWYAGLSGALHGIFAWGACVDIKEKMKSGWLLLIGLAIKVGYEQIDGSSEQVANLIDAKVAVDAHLFGALTGIAIFLLMFITAKRK